MNAKKIMGAVLVALLAVTAFAGVAAADETGLGTVFLYQTGAPADGTFTLGDSTVTVIGNKVSTTDLSKFVDGGKYSNGTAYYIVKLPNALVAATAGTSNNVDVIANGVVAGNEISITVNPEISGFEIAGLVIYDPSGNPVSYFQTPAASMTKTFTPSEKGEYMIQGILGPNGFAGTVDTSLLYGKKYAFNVYSTEPTLTASADTVLIGNFISVTITGQPNAQYTLEVEDFTIIADNQVVPVDATNGPIMSIAADGKSAVVKLPNTGKLVVYLKADNDDGKKTLKLSYGSPVKSVKTTVTIAKGAITATATQDSFFIGNPIGLEGTTTAGNGLHFYIEGTNFEFTQIDGKTTADGALDVENGEWTIEFAPSLITSAIEGKNLVAGTYTIVVSTYNATQSLPAGTPAAIKEAAMDEVYGTAAVTLTQPFITDVKAADIAVQGSKYKITGTAYSADDVRIYIFGTNFFLADDDETEDEAFEFELSGTQTQNMAPGTYFYLIQHPMGDKLFNVWNATGEGQVAADFYYAATKTATTTSGNAVDNNAAATFIFNAWKRGTNYAAQALLNEISGQNIDDIFVQGTFEVEAQKLTINPIPAEVVKGTALSISGTSNSGDGVEVIVNVLAGTFGATVKGDENAATFLTAKAVTQDDGTWEAAIDTSKLETGSYIVTVELNGKMYDSAAVSIVDKAPETPVDPVDPVDPKPVDPQPTEPETPGFGALAALAGLGAVAVLLLRRE